MLFLDIQSPLLETPQTRAMTHPTPVHPRKKFSINIESLFRLLRKNPTPVGSKYKVKHNNIPIMVLTVPVMSPGITFLRLLTTGHLYNPQIQMSCVNERRDPYN